MIQIKIFHIPFFDEKLYSEEMNKFLRSHKILEVISHFSDKNSESYWCFCVKYMYNSSSVNEIKPKKDYKNELEDHVFKRFSDLRVKRKMAAQEFAVPAFAVFTDEELVELSKLNDIDAEKMKSIKGIGAKKIERFGKFFFDKKEETVIDNKIQDTL